MISINNNLYITGFSNVWKVDQDLNIFINYYPGGTSPFNKLQSIKWVNIYVAAASINLKEIQVFNLHLILIRRFNRRFNRYTQRNLNFIKCSCYRLRSSKSYKYLLKKWPVHIYFQIRFQEIASKFEQNLINHQQSPGTSETDFFHLRVTNCLYESLNYCWNENCFLNCLTSNFWKLNLQLLSRYENFYRLAVIEQQSVNSTATEAVHSVEQPSLIVPQHQPPQVNDLSDLKLLVYLMADIKKLCDRLPNFFDGNVAPLRRASVVKEIGFVKGFCFC